MLLPAYRQKGITDVAVAKLESWSRLGIHRVGIRKTSPSGLTEVETIQANGTSTAIAPTTTRMVEIVSWAFWRKLVRASTPLAVGLSGEGISARDGDALTTLAFPSLRSPGAPALVVDPVGRRANDQERQRHDDQEH